MGNKMPCSSLWPNWQVQYGGCLKCLKSLGSMHGLRRSSPNRMLQWPMSMASLRLHSCLWNHILYSKLCAIITFQTACMITWDGCTCMRQRQSSGDSCFVFQCFTFALFCMFCIHGITQLFGLNCGWVCLPFCFCFVLFCFALLCFILCLFSHYLFWLYLLVSFFFFFFLGGSCLLFFAYDMSRFYGLVWFGSGNLVWFGSGFV